MPKFVVLDRAAISAGEQMANVPPGNRRPTSVLEFLAMPGT